MKQLGNEDAWCPLAAIPSIDLKTVNAGISQVFRLLIKSFFGLLTYDMRGGIHLADGTVHTGERVRLFATLSMVLQDGGAQKLVWGVQGRRWNQTLHVVPQLGFEGQRPCWWR